MKQYIILLIIAVLSLVSGFIYLNYNYSASKKTSVYAAIPSDSPILAEIQPNGLSSLKNTPILKILKNSVGEMEQLWFSKLDSVINSTPEIEKNLRNDIFLVSLNFGESKALTPLIVHQSSGRKEIKSIEKLAGLIYPKVSFTFEKTKTKLCQSVIITSKTTGNKFFFCFYNGLFIASSSQLLFNQSLSLVNSTKEEKSTSSGLVKKDQISNELISVFINYKTLSRVFDDLINPDSFIRIHENKDTLTYSIKSLASGFKNFAAHSKFDLLSDDSSISLSGVTAAPDSTKSFLGIFKGQNPQGFQAGEVIPVNALFYVSFSFSDKKLFFKQLDNYSLITQKEKDITDYFEKTELLSGHNLKSELEELIDNEIIVSSIVSSENSQTTSDFLIFHVTSNETALNKVKQLIEDYTPAVTDKSSPLISEIAINDTIKETVYKFPFELFPEKWLGMPFSFVNASYVAFWHNYMVFSNSIQGMEEYLKNLHADMVLANSERYNSFKSKKMTDRANISLYLNLEKISPFYKNIFTSEILKKIDVNQNELSQIKAVSWQIVNDNALYYNVLALTSDTTVKDSIRVSLPPETTTNETLKIQESPLLIWKIQSGNQITLQPEMVINHNDPANLEIIYQDKKNNLILITKDGKTWWRKPVSGPILNKIHQVDILKNGKLQYLFNTDDKLYLVDRNGKDVSPFPLILPSVATTGVSVFDYENDKNYRFFIPCADKKVYAFDKTGKKIPGWQFGQTESNVNTPLQFIRHGGKDYLFFKDHSKLYVLDRKGQTRIKTPSGQDFSDNPVFFQYNPIPKFVLTNKKGLVWFYGLNGKTENKKFGNFSKNHYFVFAEPNQAGNSAYIFLDNQNLQVFDESGKANFSRQFKNTLENAPQIVKVRNQKKEICITDEKANEIFLFNFKGELHKDFPVTGNTGCSVGVLWKKAVTHSLITGGKDGVLYHYKID